MSKIKLNDGDTYIQVGRSGIWRLTEDYNGLWYLANRNSEGLYKTGSMSKDEIAEIIERCYRQI